MKYRARGNNFAEFDFDSFKIRIQLGFTRGKAWFKFYLDMNGSVKGLCSFRQDIIEGFGPELLNRIMVENGSKIIKGLWEEYEI